MIDTVEYVYEAEPVPFERMNSLNRWAPRVQRYLEYKTNLAFILAVKFRLQIPPEEDRTAKYALYLIVYRARDAGDLDNFAKPVKDAIASAGLVWNDKAIIEYKEPFRMTVDRENPRVWLKLEKIS